MNNTMQVFQNEHFGAVRTLDENGKVYFCGLDAASALGYAKPRNAIQAHCRYALKRGVPHPQTPGKTIEMLFIPEGDLYRLITHSRLPAAEAFEKWVFDEVLPTIRKTGSYGAPQALSGDTLSQLVASVQALTEQVEQLKSDRLPARLSLQFPDLCLDTALQSRATRKRWMRSLNGKLDLLELKFDVTRNTILHWVYEVLESKLSIILDEERLKRAEQAGADSTALETIFSNSQFRETMEHIIDSQLAPEYRGW